MENGERGEPRGIVKTERRIWAVTSAQQRPLWRIFSTHSPSIRPGLSQKVHHRADTSAVLLFHFQLPHIYVYEL